MKTVFYISSIIIFILNTVFINQSNAQMFWNQACTFKGGTDSSHVSVRDAATLDITGSFTIEAWINPETATSPTFQIILQKRFSGANGYTLYLSAGRIAIRTNATTRLVGNTVIQNDTWTHIAGTYNLATNTFATYVNGSLDSSVVIAAAAPVTNSDSVLIGTGFNSPYDGKMDEVRIWNRALTATEVRTYFRTSLGSNTGSYSGLVLSLTFQDNDANGNPFILSDWSTNGNNGVNRSVIAFDMSNRPLTTIQTNDCIELDGTGDYLTAPDNTFLNPNSQITLTAWIYLRSYANSIILHKGPSTGGAATNYRLSLTSRKLSGAINGNFITTNDTIPLNIWTYVTYSYNSLSSSYQFHINGELVYSGILAAGNIVNGTDSLYIGGSQSLTNFNGYIDEVRIIPNQKFTEYINQYMFISMDLSNEAPSAVVYNFDGYAHQNASASTPICRFNGNSSFAHFGSDNDQPQTPMNRADNLNFQSGFQQKYSGKRIPASGNSGTITDSLKILLNESISDIKVFVALNHNVEQELEIFLYGPGGNVQLYDNHMLKNTSGDHLATIFDDNADSSLVTNRYVSFSPRIKPFQNLISVFGGSNSEGLWRLVIRDIFNSGSGDTGILYGWGIQFNNRTTKPYLLNTSALIQGFYNSGSNTMIRDTMRFKIRNTAFPYGIYDSATSYLTTTGFSQINFSNVSSGVGYFLQLNHRNSLETWNSAAVYYDPLTFQAEYSFRSSNLNAYGNNEILVDLFTSSFAIFSGDVNQDGIIDASDLSETENDATAGAVGYVSTDVTGDDFVDVSDIGLVENNIGNSKEVPPGAVPQEESISERDKVKSNNNIYTDPNIDLSNGNQNDQLNKRKRADMER